jgi:hypothetical protein
MSTRTVIELNHDYISELLSDPKAMAAFLLFLSSGAAANARTWDTDLGFQGIRVLGQRHHSETLLLTVR